MQTIHFEQIKMYNPEQPNSFTEIYNREQRLKKKRKQQLLDFAMETALRKRVDYSGGQESSDESIGSPKATSWQAGNDTDHFGRSRLPIHSSVQISGFQVTEESVQDIKQQILKYGTIVALKQRQTDISVQIATLKEAEKIVKKLNNRKYYGKKISAKITESGQG